jgi:hypothetical protein
MERTEQQLRKEMIAWIWSKTHKDYKGGKGAERSILMLIPGQGTCLVYLEKMTTAELEARAKDMYPKWPGPKLNLKA